MYVRLGTRGSQCPGDRQWYSVFIIRIRRVRQNLEFRPHHVVTEIPAIKWKSPERCQDCEAAVHQMEAVWSGRISSVTRLAQHTDRKNEDESSAATYLRTTLQNDTTHRSLSSPTELPDRTRFARRTGPERKTSFLLQPECENQIVGADWARIPEGQFIFDSKDSRCGQQALVWNQRTRKLQGEGGWSSLSSKSPPAYPHRWARTERSSSIGSRSPHSADCTSRQAGSGSVAIGWASSASRTSREASWRSTPSIWENQKAASLDGRLHSVNYER